MDDLVVRRRAGLMALVAVSSLAVAAGYLWRWAVAPSPVVAAVAIVLAVIGASHAVAWRRSREPVAAADPVGLRLRLGSAWCGLPWEQVERVEVDRPSRFRDGHIAVAPLRTEAVLAELPTSAQWAARLNRLVYGAPLVVPFGVSTTASVVDVSGALSGLAGGRTRVVLVDDTDAEPAPSVEITRTVPADAELAGQPHSGSDRPTGRPLARAVSALRSLSARESVRPASGGVPGAEPSTLGALALAPADDEERTVELPELDHLRRRGELTLDDELNAGPAEPEEVVFEPVGLAPDIPGARAVMGLGDADACSDRLPDPTLLIGGQVTAARHALRLSVDELAERTMIRPYVIEAIEVDDFEPCGGDFYARGHLRMLARVLGIDAGPLLSTYDAAFAAAPVDPRAVFDAELRTGGGLAKGSTGGPSWALLLGTVLVLLLVWGVARFVASDATPTPGSAGTHGNAAGLGSPGAGDQPLPSPVHKVQVDLRAVGGQSRVVVTDRSRHVLFAGMLVAGHAEQVSGAAPLQVVADNGGVVSLSAPGHHAGLLGKPGQRVVTHIRAH